MYTGVAELECSLIRLPDEEGTEVIGSNAIKTVTDALAHRKRRSRKTQADQREFSLMERALRELPDTQAEGSTVFTTEEMAQSAGIDPMWMYRLRDIEKNTTKALKSMKEVLLEDMPEDDERREWVTTVFDGIVSQYVLFGQQQVMTAGLTDEVAQRALGITSDILYTEHPYPKPTDTDLHKSITTLLRQTHGHLIEEARAGALWEINKEQMVRFSLMFDGEHEDYNSLRTLLRLTGSLGTGIQQLKETKFNREKSAYHSTQAAVKAGVSDLMEPFTALALMHLGDYAPSTKAWKSGLQRLTSGEKPNLAEVIKEWPLGSEYVETFGDTPSKKKKKKRRAKKKSKQAGSGATEGTTTATVSAETEAEVISDARSSETRAIADEGENVAESSARRTATFTQKQGQPRKQRQRHFAFGDLRHLVSIDPENVHPAIDPSRTDESRDWLPTHQTLEEMQKAFLSEFKIYSKGRNKREKRKGGSKTPAMSTSTAEEAQAHSVSIEPTRSAEGANSEDASRINLQLRGLDLAPSIATSELPSSTRDPALIETLEKYMATQGGTADLEEMVSNLGGWNKVTQAWDESYPGAGAD